jgi:hypothetical protein
VTLLHNPVIRGFAPDPSMVRAAWVRGHSLEGLL